MKKRIGKILNSICVLAEKPANPVLFFLFPVIVMGVLCLSSALIVTMNVPLHYNHEVAYTQRAKIRDAGNRDTKIVILGDSSAGNAVDARKFSAQLGKKTLNLSLTGSYGLQGSALILQDAIENLPNLESVYFIHTPQTWTREFNDEGYFILRRGLDSDPIAGFAEAREARRDYLSWLATPKRLWWTVKRLHGSAKEDPAWDDSADYLRQKKKIPLSTAQSIWTTPLAPVNDRLAEEVAVTWKTLCRIHGIKCYSAFGPLYDGAIEPSRQTLDRLISSMPSRLGGDIIFDPALVIYGYDMLGDTRNHVSLDKKDLSTKEYLRIYHRMGGS